MQNYENILSVICEEINRIDCFLYDFLNVEGVFLPDELKSFVCKKSKKIRSVLSVLFIKGKYCEITEKQLKILAITELIHNASLIHDDIIDDAEIRRHSASVNQLFGNSMAVIAGDYILSLAFKELVKLNNQIVTELFIKSLHNICKGEFEQCFSKNIIPTMEKYIEKTELKTAELFKTSLLASLQAEQQNEIIDIAKEFCKNFGIMFQIKDDLTNFIHLSKSEKSDFNEGIYTAPVIFWSKSKNITEINLENYEDIKNSDAINETENLLSSLNRKNLDLISYLPDNQYKSALTDLCMEVQKG